MANYTILLIDYEPRSIERFRDPLVAAGYTVEIATDGVSGIEAFHRLNPDMVLVEAMIPKKHGFEVCQELKRTPHGRRTPVLITTGVYKGRKYRTQALHIYGCDEYIEKPIAPEQLLGIVGKFFGPGSASASARAEEPAPAPAERAPEPTPPAAVPAAATAVSSEPAAPQADRTKPTPVPKSLVDNDTEDEIMARLDFILPDGGVAPQVAEAPAAMVATLDLPMEVPELAEVPEIAELPEIAEVPEPVVDVDPFLQMRAELDAELGSFSAALAVDPVPEAMPSDQVSHPSLLESLPEPEIEVKHEPAMAPEPAPEPEATNAKAGQVVNFDTKRGRKHKNKKSKAGREQQQTATPPAPPAPPAPIAAKPAKPRPEITLPAGTLVESTLDPTAARRGVPLWMWGAAAVVVIGAAYFAMSRGGAKPTELPVQDAPIASTQSASAQAPEPAPAEAAAAPVPAPVTTKPSVAQKLVPEAKKPAPDVATAAAPKKSPELLAAAPPAKPQSKPVVTTKKAAALKAAPIAAPASPDSEESAAGVEALPDAAAGAPSSTIAPGTLVASDEVDVLPVSLLRKAPTYSLQAREMRLAGTVVMNVLINEHGTVDQVVLVTGVPGADLNDSAIRAAKSWTYRPASMKGVPVKVWKSEQIEFKQ